MGLCPCGRVSLPRPCDTCALELRPPTCPSRAAGSIALTPLPGPQPRLPRLPPILSDTCPTWLALPVVLPTTPSPWGSPGPLLTVQGPPEWSSSQQRPLPPPPPHEAALWVAAWPLPPAPVPPTGCAQALPPVKAAPALTGSTHLPCLQEPLSSQPGCFPGAPPPWTPGPPVPGPLKPLLSRTPAHIEPKPLSAASSLARPPLLSRPSSPLLSPHSSGPWPGLVRG